jgi:hypothetical protein
MKKHSILVLTAMLTMALTAACQQQYQRKQQQQDPLHLLNASRIL